MTIRKRSERFEEPGKGPSMGRILAKARQAIYRLSRIVSEIGRVLGFV